MNIIFPKGQLRKEVIWFWPKGSPLELMGEIPCHSNSGPSSQSKIFLSFPRPLCGLFICQDLLDPRWSSFQSEIAPFILFAPTTFKRKLLSGLSVYLTTKYSCF